MFEARIQDTRLLKETVSTISSLVKDQCTFNISKDGIKLAAMDPANVAMVIFNLLSPAFETFEVDQETNITVDIENLTTVLKRAKPSDGLTLKLENEKLMVTYEGKSIRTFAIALLDTTDADRPVPKLDFPATAELRAEILKDGIEDAKIVSDNVIISIGPEGFHMEAEGDTGNTALQLAKESDGLIKAEAKDVTKSRYSLDYLMKMVSGTKIAPLVSVSLGNDYPMRMDFTQIDKVNLSFILAPRVDTD